MTEACCETCGAVISAIGSPPSAPSSIAAGWCEECKEDLPEAECPHCGRSHKPDLEPEGSESVIPAGRCSDCWPGAVP